MAVTKRVRYEVLRRDKFRCRYCGATPLETELQVDHVIPVVLGGSDNPGNLVAACEPCNTGKTSVPPDAPLVAQLASDAERWARALVLAAAQRAAQRAQQVDQLQEFLDEWTTWTVPPNRWRTEETPVPIDGNWRSSVQRWLDSGLDMQDLLDLVPVAMNSQAKPYDTWRYFAGCAWRCVTEAQEQARELVDSGAEL